MVFNDFLQLIHNGVKGGFELVNVTEGYCIECKDRYDLICTLRKHGFLSDLSYHVTGVQPYTATAIIIEFEKV